MINSSTANAVETAIDLSKSDANSKWGELMRKSPTSVKRWSSDPVEYGRAEKTEKTVQNQGVNGSVSSKESSRLR